MKLYVTLILAAITMAFVTGHYALFLQGPYRATAEDLIAIEQFKLAFKKANSPVEIYNFQSYMESRHRRPLFSPRTGPTRPLVESGTNISFSTSENCFQGLATLLNLFFFEKALVWEQFRCGHRSFLPEDFFLTPPFLHPSGESYVALAFKMGKTPFRSAQWLREVLPYAHVEELPEIGPLLGEDPLPPLLEFLVDLPEDAIHSFVRAEETILVGEDLFMKSESLFSDGPFEYGLYSLEDLNQFLKEGPFVVSALNLKKNCLHSDDGLCWNYNVRHQLKIISKSTIFFFIGSLLIISLVVWLLLNKIRIQKLDDERKRFALRVLTHEFRTPVSSLLLQIERINKDLHLLTPDLQESFLRLSDDVYRLQRLTEKSQTYLHLDKHSRLLHFTAKNVESLNDFFEQFLSPYQEDHPGDITFRPLAVDSSMTFDPYWVGICLKNLIDNAFFHGRPPIEVMLLKRGQQLEITITDQGTCQFKTLEELTRPFNKGGQSEGTGLGLNIVNSIINDMGGRLYFKNAPTRFKIVLKSQSKLNKNKNKKSLFFPTKAP